MPPEKSVLQQVDEIYAAPAPQSTGDKILAGAKNIGYGIMNSVTSLGNKAKSALGIGGPAAPARPLAPGETVGNRALADMMGDKNKVYRDRNQVQMDKMMGGQ